MHVRMYPFDMCIVQASSRFERDRQLRVSIFWPHNNLAARLEFRQGRFRIDSVDVMAERCRDLHQIESRPVVRGDGRDLTSRNCNYRNDWPSNKSWPCAHKKSIGLEPGEISRAGDAPPKIRCRRWIMEQGNYFQSSTSHVEKVLTSHFQLGSCRWLDSKAKKWWLLTGSKTLCRRPTITIQLNEREVETSIAFKAWEYVRNNANNKRLMLWKCARCT